jgi:uncharacterized protein YqgC (DUF456 family)
MIVEDSERAARIEMTTGMVHHRDHGRKCMPGAGACQIALVMPRVLIYSRRVLPFVTDPQNATQALGVLFIVVGFVGVFLPVLPGPIVIWIGALLWAIGDQFQRVGWPVLIAMAALMVVGWGSNLFLTGYFTRRSSASWKTVVGAIAGGIVGGVLLSSIPVIGAIAGAVVGGVLGVLAVELLRSRRLVPALRSSRDYLLGCVFGQMVELFFALLMIALFVWRATS